MKRAIIYYSLTNNTERTAKGLASKLNADLYKIETVKAYPRKKSSQMFYCGMQATFNLKPAIKPLDLKAGDYDEIILGTPIWAGKNVPPVNTLLKNSEICDKITSVFTFSGGGDNEKCMEALKSKLPNLKSQVAFGDENGPCSADNQEKLEKYLENFTK